MPEPQESTPGAVPAEGISDEGGLDRASLLGLSDADFEAAYDLADGEDTLEDEADEDEPASVEDAEEDDESDEESDDDESEEDDDAEAPPEQPTTAEAWARVLLRQPQRSSEVPKKFRARVEALVEEDRLLLRGALASFAQQQQQAQQRVAVLRELWEDGDVEAYKARAAEDPDAERLFLRMRAAEVEAAARNRPVPEDQQRIQQLASAELAKLEAHPEAVQRVRERFGSMSATPEDLAALSAAVATELAGVDTPARRKAQAEVERTQQAAARRKGFARTDGAGGRSSRGKRSAQELLALSDAELAEAWG